MNPKSKDLIARLRIVAGQDVIKPPAIDIEAANHIEQLEKELARARRRLPNLLPGQLEKDVPWRNVQPDSFCHIMSEMTVFDGKGVLRAWNAMRDALLKRHDGKFTPLAVNTNADASAVLTQYGAEIYNKAHECIPAKYRSEPKKAGDVMRSQLWTFMNIFGPFLYMGNTEVPFKENTFTLIDPRAD